MARGVVKIYVAAPMDRIDKAKDIARRLAADGHEIVSTWHVICQVGDHDPLEQKTRSDILYHNLADLDKAVAVVAYVAGGTPKATWGEVGWALAKGKYVLFAVAPGANAARSIFDAHERSLTYSSDELLLPAVEKMYQRMAAE